MNYQQAAEWLEALANPERSGLGPRFARRMNLDATQRMMALLGDPHAGLRAVHVAGTKGKGSVAAMIESAARAAGHSTGLFTSPHIISWRERIRLDGQPIPEAEIARMASVVRPAVERVEAEGLRRPSFFEATAAMAFLAFAEAEVDLSVVEVGLGGRLDATNVLTPLISVISTLGMEHTRVLGDTIERIAAEKAGIIKPGVPVAVAPQEPGAASVVARIAREHRASLRVARPFVVDEVEPLDPDDVRSGELPIVTEPLRGTFTGREIAINLPLLGEHQAVNAAVAGEVCEAMRELGISMRPGDFARGLEAVRWPARVELLGARPWLIADCAHNRESARALMAALTRHFKYGRLVVVLGVSKDKNAREIARELPADLVILTQATLSRAMPVEDLAERTRDLWRSCEILPDPSDALARALAVAGPRDAVCVAGSVFLIDDLVEQGDLVLPSLEP